MPRGGIREGAGAKKRIKRWSDKVRKNYEQADRFFARYLAGEEITVKRMTPEMATIGLLYGLVYDRATKTWIEAKVQEAVRLGAQKLRQEALVIKESSQTIERHEIGPVIGLPDNKRPENPEYQVISTTRPS